MTEPSHLELIELPHKADQPEDFESGNQDVDGYWKHRIIADRDNGLTRPYVLRDKANDALVGYYTLSNYVFMREEAAGRSFKDMLSYSIAPATLVGMLGRSLAYRGRGAGPMILFSALRTAAYLSQFSASIAVVVDTVSEEGRRLYSTYDFQEFKSTPERLYIPMRKVESTLIEQEIDY